MAVVNIIWDIVRGTAQRFGSQRLPLMAAAISYYALFSFIPLMALMIAFFGMTLGSPEIAAQVEEGVLAVLPLRDEGLVIEAIHLIASSSRTMTALGIIGLLGASIGMVGAVRGGIDAAWGIVAPSRFVRRRLVDAGLFAGLFAILLASVLTTTAIQVVHGLSAEWLAANPEMGSQLTSLTAKAMPAIFSFVAFLIAYRFVPQTSHGFRDVWPAALLAAVLFELAKAGFVLYLGQFARIQALFGALGTVLLFLVWTYMSAIILLVGAAFGSVYEYVLKEVELEKGPRPAADPGRP